MALIPVKRMAQYNCKNCGAELYWNAKSGSLKCEYCDFEYQVTDFEDATTTKEEVPDESLDADYINEELDDGMVAYECKKCSGTVVTSKTTMAEICPYCGEAISITSKSVGKFRPKFLIPFKVEKKEAKEIYQKYVKKAKYSPKEFKMDNIVEKMQGLYAPFYLHNIDNQSNHLFTGEIITKRKSGEYLISKHDVYDLKASIDCKYEYLPTDSSVRLNDYMMKCVEPYDYKDLKSYNPAYMSGFLAEQTDEDESKINETAIKRTKEGNRTKAKGLFKKYSGVIDKSHEFHIKKHTKDYSMLPVWLLNVKYGSKKFQFAINGQTGKITGKLPLDFKKLGIVSGSTFAIGDIIMSLLQLGGIL